MRAVLVVAQFILKKDRDWRFRLLPAQTELGTALYRHFGLGRLSDSCFVAGR
jgi:predicted DCC family thiol-disulfide oxidoreductase YuxK